MPHPYEIAKRAAELDRNERDRMAEAMRRIEAVEQTAKEFQARTQQQIQELQKHVGIERKDSAKPSTGDGRLHA